LNLKIKILIILSIAFFLSGCIFSDKSDVVVETLDGFGSYNSATDTSTVNFRFYVSNENIINGAVINWKLFFISKSLRFLTFNKENYDRLLCEDIHCANVKVQENPYALLISAKVKGDFYKGKNADQIYIEIIIQDENDNSYSIKGIGKYEFTRN
jgi:hypothetical protein